MLERQNELILKEAGMACRVARADTKKNPISAHFQFDHYTSQKGKKRSERARGKHWNQAM